jgi:hypothetical protein
MLFDALPLRLHALATVCFFNVCHGRHCVGGTTRTARINAFTGAIEGFSVTLIRRILPVFLVFTGVHPLLVIYTDCKLPLQVTPQIWEVGEL